jgi:hypothetical protein
MIGNTCKLVGYETFATREEAKAFIKATAWDTSGFHTCGITFEPI